MKKAILIFAGASMLYACECRPHSTCEQLVEQRLHIINYCSSDNKMALIQATDSMIVRCHCGGEAYMDSTTNENNNN